MQALLQPGPASSTPRRLPGSTLNLLHDLGAHHTPCVEQFMGCQSMGVSSTAGTTAPSRCSAWGTPLVAAGPRWQALATVVTHSAWAWAWAWAGVSPDPPFVTWEALRLWGVAWQAQEGGGGPSEASGLLGWEATPFPRAAAAVMEERGAVKNKDM